MDADDSQNAQTELKYIQLWFPPSGLLHIGLSPTPSLIYFKISAVLDDWQNELLAYLKQTNKQKGESQALHANKQLCGWKALLLCSLQQRTMSHIPEFIAVNTEDVEAVACWHLFMTFFRYRDRGWRRTWKLRYIFSLCFCRFPQLSDNFCNKKRAHKQSFIHFESFNTTWIAIIDMQWTVLHILRCLSTEFSLSAVELGNMNCLKQGEKVNQLRCHWKVE